MGSCIQQIHHILEVPEEGTYTIRMIDENDCVFEREYHFYPLELVDLDLTHVKCHGESTGRAEITMQYGAVGLNPRKNPLAYTYLLKYTNEFGEEVEIGPQESNVFSNLPAGTYDLSVYDKNNGGAGAQCIYKNVFEILEPERSFGSRG